MKWIIKYIALVIWGNILKSIFIFRPIKRQTIVFISFNGIQVSCNPYYIYKKIIDEKLDFKCYWVTNGEGVYSIPQTQMVKLGSYQYFLLMHTAQFIVTNNRIDSFFNFRREQIVINTWHGGGAFKKTFGHPKGLLNWYINITNRRDSKRTKYFVSSSKKWTDVIARNSFKYHGEILPFGYPRNDLLINGSESVKEKVKKTLNIPSDDLIVLYAPTFRGNIHRANMGGAGSEPINVNKLLEVLSKMHSQSVHFLFRGHHSMKKGLAFHNTIDVTAYPDMQELLLVADMLISDFSSCMWDYALTFKPCFIYAPDFDLYKENPGFESDYNEWPFPIAYNNTELIEKISNFNQDNYKQRVKNYLSLYGSYENGNASEQLIKFMQGLSS